MLDDDRPQQAEPDARNSPPRLLNHLSTTPEN
jgi:hypothetical protein